MVTFQSWVIWLLVNSSPENGSSEAIRTFSAIVHKELETTILKNKVSLLTPQSLPPKPVSERPLAFFITFSPNSFVHLFLGKDTLSWTFSKRLCEPFSLHVRTEVLIWKKTEEVGSCSFFPSVPHPWKMHYAALGEGRSWTSRKHHAQTKSSLRLALKNQWPFCSLEGRSNEG